MSSPELSSPPRRQYWVFLVPLCFALLAGLLYVGLLHGDASVLPSALIGRPVPTMALAPLESLLKDGKPVPGLASDDLKSGGVTIVNVFASWCGPCQEEHPALMELARLGKARIVAINYKDQPENARRFLGEFGNPYSAVGVDPNGRMAIEWGVYGVPETFVVGKNGTIVEKFVGPISTEARFADLRAAIEKAASK